MKRFLLICFLLIGIAQNVVEAQNVTVTLTTDEGFENSAIIAKLQDNLSKVLTEINTAQKEVRPLNIVGLPMNDFASKSLSMLWANVHFYCDDEEVVERCWPLANGYMIRRIPLIITPQGEDFGSGTYQEAVIEFNLNGVITDFRFCSDLHLGESMESGGNEVVDAERRMQILTYCERLRTAYNQKNMEFLRQVFSDDALIITGSVIKTKPSEVNVKGAKVVYKKQTKAEYLANLNRAFLRNKWIDVKFTEIGENGETGGPKSVTQSKVNKNMYGVRLRQEWKSSTYSDEGYLFLLWDFTNEEAPVIHVRTWQPQWVGGEKLPDEEIFSLKNFDL